MGWAEEDTFSMSVVPGNPSSRKGTLGKKLLSPPPPARSRIMQSIKGRGNRTTEERFRLLLQAARLPGWRRHLPLPGRPDFCWPREKVAVFVDGCFWHGCPRCYREPRTNRSFWREKIESNRRRDRRVGRILRSEGWSVFRIWECKLAQPGSMARLSRKLATRIPGGI